MNPRTLVQLPYPEEDQQSPPKTNRESGVGINASKSQKPLCNRVPPRNVADGRLSSTGMVVYGGRGRVLMVYWPLG